MSNYSNLDEQVYKQLKRIGDVLERMEAKLVDRSTTPATPPGVAELPTEKVSAFKCPICSGPMRDRTRRSDGVHFWGCSAYPNCTGTRDVGGKITCRIPMDDPDDSQDSPPF